MSKKRRVGIKTERIVYTYNVLRAASWNALKHARESETGRFYSCMTVIIYSAFCIEAYLNHIGPHYVPYWDSIERLGPKEKLKIVSHHIKYQIDFGKRPFQTFVDIKKFRDLMAHGKTERLRFEGEGFLDFPHEEPEMQLTDWEKVATMENAEIFFEDTRKMITELHKKAGFSQDAFFTPWTEEYEVKPLD